MSKFITSWNTTAEYDAVKDNLAKPQVALTKDNNTVHYNPYVDPYNGHDYVDLDLPSGTKWATMNVGAESETSYGNYYGYGKGSTQYHYGDSRYEGVENPLATNADTAAQVWGGSWHMPTETQMKELTANTNYEWTTINGIKGLKFKSKKNSSKYVFFPMAGYIDSYYESGSPEGIGTNCYSWSSTPVSIANSKCFDLSQYNRSTNTKLRTNGLTVRAVVG